jgi:hypothetical protein
MAHLYILLLPRSFTGYICETRKYINHEENSIEEWTNQVQITLPAPTAPVLPADCGNKYI